MPDAISTILLALFGGAGATLTWEALLKPHLDRRSLAEVLAAEISINLQLLGVAKVGASATKVPPDFALGMSVYSSVLPRLGVLPPRLVGEAVFLYRYFEELSRLPTRYVHLIAELRTSDENPSLRAGLEKELQVCVNVFNSYVDKAIDRINLVQPMLLAAAFPRWSFRRYKRRRSESLSFEEIARRLALSREHREAVRRALEDYAEPK